MEIDAHTGFCGVIGNPVEHSLSPAIHNAAFRKLGVNLVYLAFRVEAIGDAINGLRALGGFRGASVTIPHKVSAMLFLDTIDPTARQIGAINTIVAEHGKLIGYNTDATGAFEAKAIRAAVQVSLGRSTDWAFIASARALVTSSKTFCS